MLLHMMIIIDSSMVMVEHLLLILQTCRKGLILHKERYIHFSMMGKQSIEQVMVKTGMNGTKQKENGCKKLFID